MKLPDYVKPMPNIIYSLFKTRGIQIILTRNIYLRKDIYEDLLTKNPNKLNISFLVHEEEHRRQPVSIIEFLTIKKRLAWEFSAYKRQFAYLKKSGEKTYDFDRAAEGLSGPHYLWMSSYENVRNELEKVWREA